MRPWLLSNPRYWFKIILSYNQEFCPSAANFMELNSTSLCKENEWFSLTLSNICRNSQCSNTKSTIHKNYKLARVGQQSNMRDSQYVGPVSAVNHQRLMSFQFFSNIRNKRSSELVRDGQLLEWSMDMNIHVLICENHHPETMKKGQHPKHKINLIPSICSHLQSIYHHRSHLTSGHIQLLPPGPTCRGSSCPWHGLMSAPGADHSLPLTGAATAISTGLCSPFPNAINLNDTQIDSIPVFEHQLKNISKQQIRLMMHLISWQQTWYRGFVSVWPRHSGHAFRESKPLTGGCEKLCVINCKYFCQIINLQILLSLWMAILVWTVCAQLGLARCLLD